MGRAARQGIELPEARQAIVAQGFSPLPGHHEDFNRLAAPAGCIKLQFSLILWNRGRKTGRTLRPKEETTMAWTTPTLVEICIGLEINGYLPAEF